MNRHPRGTRPSRRAVVGVACAIAASVVGPGVHAQADPDLDAAVRLVVGQSNSFRRAERLAPLRVDAVLAAVAQGFADSMASTDRYGHEADGRSPAQRVVARGYAYCAIAENIAFLTSSAGFASDTLAGAFVDGWKTSPPHRRNLLGADVSEIGVGIAHSRKSSRYYAVQVF